MANPQLENGHTRIANEILDALMRTYISPNQWQILVCIVRKTYGYKKKVDYIANSQIQHATGLGKSVVCRALRELRERNIIIRTGKVSGIQKDWEKWKVSSTANPSVANQDEKVSSSVNSEKLAEQSTELAEQLTELAEQSTKVSSLRCTQKKKETIQKKLYKRKRGEFHNVLLTDEEYQKLKDNSRLDVDSYIERLSGYIESVGKNKYKSHYATILNWQRRDTDAKAKGRGLPKTYTPSPNDDDL